MTGTLSKRCGGRTDRRTERSVLRAAWSQLKNSWRKHAKYTRIARVDWHCSLLNGREALALV